MATEIVSMKVDLNHLRGNRYDIFCRALHVLANKLNKEEFSRESLKTLTDELVNNGVTGEMIIRNKYRVPKLQGLGIDKGEAREMKISYMDDDSFKINFV